MPFHTHIFDFSQSEVNTMLGNTRDRVVSIAHGLGVVLAPRVLDELCDTVFEFDHFLELEPVDDDGVAQMILDHINT